MMMNNAENSGGRRQSPSPAAAHFSTGVGSRGIPRPVDGDVERVIVIGAGMAGITTARALHRAGVEVVVLEARDRIGGRLHTVDLGGSASVEATPVDLGGAWIHDGERSELLPLVEHLRATTQAARATALAAAARVLHRATGEYPDDARREALRAAFARFDKEGRRAVRRHGDRRSLAEGVDRLVHSAPAEVRRTLTDLLSIYDSESPERSGFGTFGSFYFGGGADYQDVFLDGGYRTLVDALAAELPIRSGCVVHGIAQDSRGVTVSTSQGDERGSHVVVTVPLAVLRSGAIAITPELPLSLRTAMASMGVGRFEKVAIALDEPIDARVDPAPIVVMDARRRGWPLVLDLQQWHAQPALVALTVGDHARRVARLSVEQRIAEVVAIASEAAGRSIRVTDAIVSDWTNDPYSRGSYTIVPRGLGAWRTIAALRTLATPVGRLLFAGEATAGELVSVVDGAYTSGIREAKRLLGQRQVELF